MATAFAAAGDKLESGTGAVRRTFGNPDDTHSLDQPTKVTVTKTANGYDLAYGEASFSFTDSDLVDGYYEKETANSSASLFALEGDTDVALSSPRAMVPLGFGAALDGDDAAGTDDATSQLAGYTVVGLETNPDDMPNSGTATYTGKGRFDFYNKSFEAGSEDVRRIRYGGNSSITADFDAATVNGQVDVTNRVVRLGDGTNTADDISAKGASVGFESNIVENGFVIDEMLGNAALEAELADVGIGEVEAGGEGRFYGENAESVGAVISGESETAAMTGIIYGDEVK